SVIEELTELQSIQSRLKDLRQDDRQGVADLSAEVRSIYRQLQARQAAGDIGTPPESPSYDALQEYVSAFRHHLEELERQRPGGAFFLGRIEVNVVADAVQVPTAETVDEAQYRERNARVISEALNLVPGVSIQRIGARNERGVFVRGFDARQVPLYVDGIPVYVPYDGYVDMDRFLTYDISEIQVAKGFTSPLYGPNAIGGAVNVITKAPAGPLNLDMGAGYASGDQVNGFLNTGAKWRRFWIQGGFSWLSSETFPLSGKWRPIAPQPAGDRNNVYQTDYKTRIRATWTPNASDQYTFTYANQKGEKGSPPYAGTDEAVRPRYWQWPQWDKESFYFIGNQSLGETGYLRARLYYDRFNNLLKAFDDARYLTQTKPSSFTSPYDDDTYGTVLELGSRALSRQTLKGSFYYKDDTHREGNLGEPERSFRDQSFSVGLEDTVHLAARTFAVLGTSGDRIKVLNAEDYRQSAVLPFSRNDLWAFNAQAGVFHALTDSSKLRFTFARKTRLPTIKDRYSYRLGQAEPNPELREERSTNWEAGYSHLLGRATFVDAALFLSDVSNVVQRSYISPNLYQLRNPGEARYLGSEFGLRSSLTRNILFTANYTYLSRKNLTDPSLIMVDTPRHHVYSSASYQFVRRINLLADFHFEAGRFNQNDAGTYGRSSQIAVVGLGGVIQIHKGLDLQAGIGNLFDRNYFLVDGYPEAGRNAYVNLRYRF
ncbi:MAG: TonB-dependent receptor, partial [Bryobacteraceae bacterium]